MIRNTEIFAHDLRRHPPLGRAARHRRGAGHRGRRAQSIMAGLRSALAPTDVSTGGALGIDPDAKEAVAFAALAWAHVHRIPGDVPEATGAARPRVLGSVTPGADRHAE